ncbi:hypothetical protein BC937DRAFT_89846 [Endogone sp. FLAS-F59071]|nr:hypothetical protein BC937DRAFT_89846 [Endogone sp. FLAS-F59071]|eukprot:RUS22271.1 hypothetical protein BC937DRAFT_89846 [Endogone sp. FLAS-F59071]
MTPNDFYKIIQNDKTYYLQVTWYIKDIPAEDGEPSDSICDLTLTNCVNFWARKVTLGDIKEMHMAGIDNLTFSRLIRAALSGAEEFEQRRLMSEVDILSDEAKCALNNLACLLILDYQQFNLGSLRLSVVSSEDTSSRWEEWLGYLLKERAELQERTQVLNVRSDDLESVNTDLKKQLEALEITKIDAENTLMTKVDLHDFCFKDLLNAKKRKIKLLMRALEAASVSKGVAHVEAPAAIADENVEIAQKHLQKSRSHTHHFRLLVPRTLISRKSTKRKRNAADAVESQEASQLPDLQMMTADHVAPTTATGNADKLMARVAAAAASSKKPKLEMESRVEPDLVDEPPLAKLDKSSGTNKGKGKEIEKDTKANPAPSQGSAFNDEEPPSLLEETSPPTRAPVIKSKA